MGNSNSTNKNKCEYEQYQIRDLLTENNKLKLELDKLKFVPTDKKYDLSDNTEQLLKTMDGGKSKKRYRLSRKKKQTKRRN